MTNFDRFRAIGGFFRSSGYFKLRKELQKVVQQIKILVGINVDKLFKQQSKLTLSQTDKDKAQEIYEQEFIKDIEQANYSKEIEEGILQMMEDIKLK